MEKSYLKYTSQGSEFLDFLRPLADSLLMKSVLTVSKCNIEQ